ncbi:hypothetical protein EVAR_946_1 [Eumeta japonica]|uniref:Secreted protein n=1 Tax=Eumeta variegata TaxID=151549 RepID=A0A4C1SDX5_EUMVA|nr:hypothetical protein EVAR_946_1 [Eumeta japonica]
MLLAAVHGFARALSVWIASGCDPNRCRDADRVVHHLTTKRLWNISVGGRKKREPEKNWRGERRSATTKGQRGGGEGDTAAASATVPRARLTRDCSKNLRNPRGGPTKSKYPIEEGRAPPRPLPRPTAREKTRVPRAPARLVLEPRPARRAFD